MKGSLACLILLVAVAGVTRAVLDGGVGVQHDARQEVTVETADELTTLQPVPEEAAPEERTSEDWAHGALRQIHAAQQVYRLEHGRFASIMALLDLPLDIATARLDMPGSIQNGGYHGYYFEWVPKDGESATDYRHTYVICAIPILYPYTGKLTFAVSPSGEVVSRDTRGLPLLDTAELKYGWSPES